MAEDWPTSASEYEIVEQIGQVFKMTQNFFLTDH
jgi:hypothetical protein